MSTKNTQRQEWMATLALADPARLQSAWDGLASPPAFQIIRGPETGLIMVRGRAGNNGTRFNLGEMSVTRCSVLLDTGVTGHAWIAGTHPDHARLASCFDALMQVPEHAQCLNTSLLEPLRRDRQCHLAQRHAEVVPTTVDFFTLVRGED